MKLTYHPKFKKQYAKLKPAQKERFAKALALFKVQPFHPSLYNHPQKAQWKGHRSIAFGGDWRAIYLPKGQDEAFFVTVGTHSQLYK